MKTREHYSVFLKAIYNIKYLTFIISKSTFLLIHLHCSSAWMKHSIPRINSNVPQGLTLGGPSGFHIFPIQIHQTHIFKIQGQSYNISKITVSTQYFYILMCMMSCQIQIFNCSSFLHNVKIINEKYLHKTDFTLLLINVSLQALTFNSLYCCVLQCNKYIIAMKCSIVNRILYL